MKVIQRKFTLREIILMLVLVILLFIGLYFWLIYYPIRDQKAKLNEQLDNIALYTTVADTRLLIYNNMQKAIDEIEDIPVEERTRMHKHSEKETEEIIADLKRIFGDTQPQIRYGAFVQDENIIERPISFSITISTAEDPDTAYNKCKTILYDLTHTGRRALLSDLSVSPKDGSVETDELQVSGTITFYELA